MPPHCEHQRLFFTGCALKADCALASLGRTLLNPLVSQVASSFVSGRRNGALEHFVRASTGVRQITHNHIELGLTEFGLKAAGSYRILGVQRRGVAEWHLV